MREIKIDEEVFTYLQRKAIAFVEIPNDTLRRLFGLNRSTVDSVTPRFRRGKKPKTNLIDLVNAELLVEEQEVFLRDYRGRGFDGISAKISKGNLIYEGKMYSMSDLAKILLKQQGYESNSVRGPIFWYTEDGMSIKELWEKYLETRK